MLGTLPNIIVPYCKCSSENEALLLELQVQDKLTVANKGYDAFADTIQYELPNATAYLRTSCRGKREWYRVRCTENTSHSAEAANLDKQRQQALRVWEQWFKNGGFPPPQCPPQAPSQAQVRPKERPQQLLNHAQEDLARSLAEADDWSPNSSTLSSNSSTFDPPVPDTSETTRASTSTSSSRSLRQPGSRFRASSYYSQSLSQHETTASEPMRPVPAFSYQMSSLAGPTTSNSPYTAYSSPYRPQPETSTIASRLPSYTSQLQGYQQRHAQRQSAQSSNGNALDLATPTLSFRNSSAQSQAIPTLQSTNGNTHNQATPTLQSWNGNAQSQATPTLQSSNGNAQHQAAPAFRFLPRRTGRLSEQEREQMRERVIQLQIDRRHRRQAQAQAQAQARARAQGIVHPNLNWQLQGPSQVQGQDQGQGQGNGPPNQGLDYGDGN
ncbi:hypothetical protein BDV96DRAFT_275442 [Lophiotrema nucula]|uniref:Uncharacterized protein n=1 Tax=Lophiotrema nucula TaxID=690887 RepID=A0A6A5ZNK6_9PLEO|nr:hypothetical protein BDV96DRAFT_275442 [Lophiotrema nucula]